MSKHTPGPWHWVNSQTDEPFDFDSPWDGYGRPSLRTAYTVGENKTKEVDGKQYTEWALPKWILDAEPMQNGNDMANAKLIAAAPDLLEALQAIIEDMDSEHGTEYDYNKARAAIKKATE